jgi:hypothetical protein
LRKDSSQINLSINDSDSRWANVDNKIGNFLKFLPYWLFQAKKGDFFFKNFHNTHVNTRIFCLIVDLQLPIRRLQLKIAD